MRRWVIALVALPGTVLVLIPAVLLWAGELAGIPTRPAGLASPRLWVSIVLFLPALGLSIWSMSCFARFGDGTPAPWDPPLRFVVRGPYRHLRNPMLAGVIVMLAALALGFGSWILAAWAAIFAVANGIYFVRSEEPALRHRFGDEYLRYCRHVPRWHPRLRGWRRNNSPPR